MHLAIWHRDSQMLVGLIHFSNVVRGVFQACNLGFSLDHAYVSQGFMHEALDCAQAIVFDEWGLHRVMANHLPENMRSANVLEKLGFGEEGHAKSYLKINGAWRDHVLRSKLNPSHLLNTEH
ncbi:MAG: GNAT family N-acetyltransferase [Deltaproteobacteria bacterium]|nr:GNAT family N-acetyltransferase [Deltaproteobacteria bacterium]